MNFREELLMFAFAIGVVCLMVGAAWCILAMLKVLTGSIL